MNSVVWWESESPDPAGSREFYGQLFGWSFRRAFDEPGSELGRDYAKSLGAQVERERVCLGSDDFWFANVHDPQGISLGLWTAQPRG